MPFWSDKAAAIQDLAEASGYDLAASYAYSDSVTDLPMLEAVGHAFAVNPDKALRKEAAARDWEVLDFTRPVTLRSRFGHRGSSAAHPEGQPDGAHRIPTQAVAVALGAASAATAATAGIVWLTRKRQGSV